MEASVLTPETSKRYHAALLAAATYLREQVILTASDMQKTLDKAGFIEAGGETKRVYQGYAVSDETYAGLEQKTADLRMYEKGLALHEKAHGVVVEDRAKIRDRYVGLLEEFAERIVEAARSGTPLPPEPAHVFEVLEAIARKSEFQRSNPTAANSVRELCAFYREQERVETPTALPDPSIHTIHHMGGLQQGEILPQNPASFLL